MQITVVGIGEDGAEGLTPTALKIVQQAEVLIGGKRHLRFFPDHIAEKLSWPSPFADAQGMIKGLGDRDVVVLASGDPLWQGVATSLIGWFGNDSVTVFPAPSSYALAAAALGWAVEDIITLTVHGRPLARVIRDLAPNRKLLILSRDAGTPAELAALLTECGYGPSRMTVLARLGGPGEKLTEGVAESWHADPGHDLNLVAVECRLATGVQPVPHVPGLPDEAYATDGMLTKREMRAVTLSSLAPQPGRLLWDVGAGSGSVAIEWIRAGGCAIAVEDDPKRMANLKANTQKLGTPELQIVLGRAPEALDGLAAPDAVFVGGGLTQPGLIDACREALKPGGILVANAVTIDSEQVLLRFYNEFGGDLSRLSVSRLTPRGGFKGWYSLAPVTHLVWTKS